MTTDINKLDQFIGKYVDITLADGEGGSGFVSSVSDKIEYKPTAARAVNFDYGMGFWVAADTSITVIAPPDGEAVPDILNPVRSMHLAMEDEPCAKPESCPNEWRASAALYAFRVYQMKNEDAWWLRNYVDRLRGYLDDPCSRGDIIREAGHEGAPPHILNLMNDMAERALKDEG